MGRKRSAEPRRRRRLSWRELAQIASIFLLLIGAGILGTVAASRSESSFEGKVFQVDEAGMTLQFGAGDTPGSFALRYDDQTIFSEAGRPVSPSAKLGGKRAYVTYTRSLLTGNRAAKVEFSD
jgi:hypothetical protein